MASPHKSRPAETTAVVAGTGGLVAAIATHNWLAAGVAATGYLPVAVTYLVANGGVRGVLCALWGGRR